MNSNDKLIALLKRRFAEGEEQTKHFENMCKKVRGYKPEDVAMLERMVKFIEDRVVAPSHQSRLIGGYNDQPPGCDGILTLTYGCSGEAIMIPNRWVARIYFIDNGPKIGFPIECLKSGSEEKVDSGNHAFSPIDIKDFFKCPDNYLAWDALEDRSTPPNA